MKAIVLNKYGGCEVVEFKEIEKPEPQKDDVLVKVTAASLNAGDYFSMRGSPWLIRLSVGFPRPKDHVLGWDVAGHVEAVGENVSNFQPGDTVFGSCEGTLAEFACAAEHKFAKPPTNLTLEQACTLPTAALTALEALRDVAKVQPGQTVLINGASGGVGTFAVQIAKALGAEVTGVCSARNLEIVQSIGADHVIDYAKQDFTQSDRRYDVILDNVGSRSFSDCRRALTRRGVHVPNSGHGGMKYVFKAFVLSAFMRKHARPFMTTPSSAELLKIKDLAEMGKVVPVIDRTYPLNEARAAFRYLEEEHAQGKVVVVV